MRTLPCLSPENQPCGEKKGGERGQQRRTGRERKKTNHVNRRIYTIFMISSEMFKVGQALREVEGGGEEREKTDR